MLPRSLEELQMNSRRDEQYERQQFGRHNAELQDELDRDRGRRGQDEWRSDARRGIEDGWRGRTAYSPPMVPPVVPRQYPNEGLSSDFSIEGTRSFVRDERRASHRGKGPKGFKRSDERIRELVSEALADHHDIDASDVEVTVTDGEVTLAGTVDHRDVKRLAENVVDAVAGVIDVHNKLTVKR
ncbi:MAG: BON domain-containing protein [Labilithrix sp.]|nr:BON domain-containing protein [Labilithrix sp.]MCW5809379.1 BON domain-containing protein [Labilithrix sp.]